MNTNSAENPDLNDDNIMRHYMRKAHHERSKQFHHLLAKTRDAVTWSWAHAWTRAERSEQRATLNDAIGRRCET